MSEINFAFVGSGKTLRDCLDEVKKYNRSPATEIPINIGHVFIDPSKGFFDQKLPEQLDSEGIPTTVAANINSEENLQTIKRLGIDYLISVNNHQILKKELISTPKKAVLNFHNGPLPKYGGLNACTWAIFNGESTHGVTWHYMSEKIDQGEIIVQSCFDIRNSDTAISLIMKSIVEGVKLFRVLLPDICAENLASYKQDLNERTYYSRKNIPNSGYIDYSWNYEKFLRFKRAFSFYPFENLLGPPKIKIANQTYKVLEYDYIMENTKGIDLGQIHYDETNSMLLVGMSEGVLSIKKISDHELNELPLKYPSSKKN
jgi:methionyl-tRNA formyltransferase